jgi:trans-2,3-dihydro-3-hydroxyanthranilate isomerase
MDIEYYTVDVFTQVPFEGNPLAVFPDARRLQSETMQKIARELNLSETTFILPSTREGCAARVRIFTPACEMVFAGHPTIGTAYVVRELGLVPRDAVTFALDENVGAVKIRVEGDTDPMIWLQTPEIAKGRTYDRAACAAALGLQEADLIPQAPCQMLTAGNPNIYVALAGKDRVDRAEPDAQRLRALCVDDDEPICAFVFAPTPEGAYSRMFAPELGVGEDPATGSATGPLAAFMMEHGLAPSRDGSRFISEQGTKIGRRSLLHVLVHGENGVDGIEVGGHVVPISHATMAL